jgi:6-phosphogluconolactonase (cycloisomerase 2 family)
MMTLSAKRLRLVLLSVTAALLATICIRQPLNAANDVARRTVLYAAVGATILEYDANLDTGVLSQSGSVTVPENVQEAWVSPSKKFLYVAWSDGGYSNPRQGVNAAGKHHGVTALRVDSATGELTPQGNSAALPSRPIFITTDTDGTHVLTAHNDPSNLVVHQILPDGTVGAEVSQVGSMNFGVYAHQVRVDPTNRSVILVTRGNARTATNAEQPGALRIFSYNKGLLATRQTVAPNKGYGYQIRHLDFHPSGKWDYATLEPQNKLHVYRRAANGTLSDAPIFVKDTVAPTKAVNEQGGSSAQVASSIHLHPNGRFVYVANRGAGTVEFQGKRVFAGGENSIAVFSINQNTGEPTLIQSADTRGFSPRTFALDGSGRMLVVANQSPGSVRDGMEIKTIPARLTVFHVRADGKLDFAHQYDIETDSSSSLFWVGTVSLP